MGTIVGRMLHPGSERSTHRWLQEKSGFGELVGYDFDRLSLDQFYKISDVLLSKKEELENFLYKKEKSLFNLDEIITLYDLTNTYFEGSGKYNDKAAFGRSKEKRSDCRLVTLALVLNRDGFPKRSEILPGNISEPKTLKDILQKLHTDNKATKPMIIMDAGIATEENLKYLKEQGYTYIVVSRKRDPVMPEDGDEIIVKKQGENVVTAKFVDNLETGERELYCNSTAKAKKEHGIRDTFCQRFEEDLTKLAQGLHKKGCVKKYDKVLVSLGRLKEKYKRVSGKYEITVEKGDRDAKDEKNSVAVSITWDKKQEEKSPLGIYCLRTNNPDWDEQKLWKTYTMLTEIESAFRCMKSELGMRPVYHQKTSRIDGHLFITVLAYHIIHSIRHQLKQQGVDLSWNAIREGLSSQYRLTTMLATDERQTIHVRQTSQPSQWQRKVYSLLGLAHHPGKRKVAIL
jgi:transposase